MGGKRLSRRFVGVSRCKCRFERRNGVHLKKNFVIRYQLTLFSSFRRYTALLNAAYCGRISVIETLVVFGADIDALSNGGVTAAMLAVSNECIEVVRLLLSLNADVTKIDDDGETALQRAKTDEMKQLLLDQEKKSVSEALFCLN